MRTKEEVASGLAHARSIAEREEVRAARADEQADLKLVYSVILDDLGVVTQMSIMSLAGTRALADQGHNIHVITQKGHDTARLGKPFNGKHITHRPTDLKPDRARDTPAPLPKPRASQHRVPYSVRPSESKETK